MNKKLRIFYGLGLMALLVTEFNNCGGYSNSTAASSAAVDCTTTNCIVPTLTNMSITPHLYNGEFNVTASMSEFNLGGDCNEGGYPYNKIHWELDLQGVAVRNSSMQVASGSTADTSCVNGRFYVYVNLAPVPGDEVDRAGLAIATGSTTVTTYSLKLTIFAQTQPTDPGVASTNSVAIVQLNAATPPVAN